MGLSVKELLFKINPKTRDFFLIAKFKATPAPMDNPPIKIFLCPIHSSMQLHQMLISQNSWASYYYHFFRVLADLRQ